MKQTRNVFTTEFKQEYVRLIVDQGYVVGEASKVMNVGLLTFQCWLRQ
jgi:transposase-like protein